MVDKTCASDLSDASIEPLILRGLTERQRQRLTDVLDGYLSALESGIPPAREDLLRQNADLAEPLGAYLDSLDELHDAAAGFAGGRDRALEETRTANDDEKRLGDFRLIREIGRGGMGVVYEAQQISLGRRVALKVLPFAAVLDSKQIARFKNEAQAAAQLDHPNIVSVYGIGSDRGVHYFAMQLIDSQPLDRAIEELRGISVPDRRTSASGNASQTAVSAPDTVVGSPDTVGGFGPASSSFLTTNPTGKSEYFRTVMGLGIQAAEALHAAHEYGVIHRDVKPSNLLLDGDGKLWVTDFGLARCQTDKALTRTGDLIGTMRYMSPEQTRGQSALVDQRTDVYSLGATLYELLTLEPAFPGDDGPDLLRRLGEQDPRPLKQLQPKIPTDLQTVVHKAMARRREDRYTTAQEFANDLRRVLEGKPTVARPPTVADRLGKWTRRHQRLVIAAASISLFAALGLAAGTVLIAREKARAEQNAESARHHFENAQEAVERLGLQIGEQLAALPGAGHVRRELLLSTLQYYQQFAEEAKHDPSLQADLALTYNKIGTLAEQVGSTAEAIAAHENALRLFEQLVADNPGEKTYRSRLAVCQNNLGLVLARAGRTNDARLAYGEAIRLQTELAKGSESGGQCLDDLAASYMNLGLLQSETGQIKKAEASLLEAIRLQERLLDSEPEQAEYLRALAASYNSLGALYVAEQPARAGGLYKNALAIQQEAVKTRPDELKYRSELSLTYNNLGALQSRVGELSEAADSYMQAIEMQRDLVRAAPAQNFYRRDLAVSCNNLGLAQSKLRQLVDAERSFQEALELQRLLVQQDPSDIALCGSLGGIYNNRGIVLEELERFDEAGESYQKAVTYQQIAYSHAPQVSRYRDFLSKHYFNYGRVLRRLGQADQAARVALARKKLWPDNPQRLFAIAEELALACGLPAETSQAEIALKDCETWALETLRQAVEAGFQLPPDIRQRDSFAALRDSSEFANLIKD